MFLEMIDDKLNRSDLLFTLIFLLKRKEERMEFFLCKLLLCYTCMLSLNDKAQNYTLVSWIIQYILVSKSW